MKIAILTNLVPKYRRGFYEILFKNESHEIHVFCQKEIPGENYETIHNEYKDRIHEVSFWSTKGLSICWQFFPTIKIYRDFDIIFIDGNPRIISQALFATFLRITGKKVIIWSMLHSFNNIKVTENIRVQWLKIFKYHFFYNDQEVEKLNHISGFGNKIIGSMNNGLDQNKIEAESLKWDEGRLKEWRVAKFGKDKKFNIVTFGRLQVGKYEVMVDVIENLKDKIPDLFCCIIGDGQARLGLEQMFKERNLSQFVHFSGAIHEDEHLAPYLLSAKLLVHPTAVGLSIMHCFGYGLPIITHNNAAYHGPEFVAFKNYENGLSYEHNDTSDLIKKTLYLLNDEVLRRMLSENARKIVQEKYNTSVMADRFIKMAITVAND